MIGMSSFGALAGQMEAAVEVSTKGLSQSRSVHRAQYLHAGESHRGSGCGTREDEAHSLAPES
jgi:hypothetical protein